METAEGAGGVVGVMCRWGTEDVGGGFAHAEGPFSRYPTCAVKLWDWGVRDCGWWTSMLRVSASARC